MKSASVRNPAWIVFFALGLVLATAAPLVCVEVFMPVGGRPRQPFAPPPRIPVMGFQDEG